MAVSGVSSSSSLYGNRNVISGLASGMDTESMIENMVSGTKNKIQTQKQKQQTLLWQQEAFRKISDQLVQISSKYASYTSSTNLLSPSFFSPSIITPKGEYAKYISATGKTSNDVRVQSVDQLAKVAQLAVAGVGKTGTVEGDTAVDFSGKVDVSNVAGQGLTFQYGNQIVSLYLDSNKRYETADDVAKEINTQLENAKFRTSNGETVTLGDKVKASVTSDGKFSFAFTDPANTNTMEILDSSSQKLLDAIGFADGDKMSASTGGLMVGGNVITRDDLYTEKNPSEVMAGQSMTFTFNGTKATIKMPAKDTDAYRKIFEATDGKRGEAMQSYLQTELDKAFGYGRVTVSGGNGETFKPSFTTADPMHTLSVDSGSSSLVGLSGVFGLERGATNRINVDKKLGDLFGSDITNNMTAAGQDADGNDLYAFQINGVTIGKYNKDTKLSTIMNDINTNKDAGVKVSYSKTADQFVFTSTHGGAGGKVEIGGADNLAAKMFGTVDASGVATPPAAVAGGSAPTASYVKGEDAKMTVTINGTKTTLTSGTNTFNVDGLNISASGTFTSVDASGVVDSTKEVSFSSKVDSDKIIDAMKDFVKEYNQMLDDLNTEIRQKHTRSYAPLTDDQKESMSESQIKAWETEAKKGLLFADNDLSALSDSMRFMFSPGGERTAALTNMGFTVSTSYSDNGKISLDETKLRAALDTDPTAVGDAFAASMSQKTVTNSDGTTKLVDDTSSGGVMTRMKVVLDRYAKTDGTKGILIERAGSKYSPLSLLNNSLQKQYDDLDDVIYTLTNKLSKQVDRYTRQFTQLEKLMSQMNSQSSSLAGMMGGNS